MHPALLVFGELGTPLSREIQGKAAENPRQPLDNAELQPGLVPALPHSLIPRFYPGFFLSLPKARAGISVWKRIPGRGFVAGMGIKEISIIPVLFPMETILNIPWESGLKSRNFPILKPDSERSGCPSRGRR